MLNIVIPMAGAGSRFADEGYTDPKPLIRINDVPMISLVISNLKPECEHKFIFICQQDHVLKYDLRKKLNKWADSPIIIEIDGITQGAACTVLKAKEYINNQDELMIANSDQYIDININSYLNKMSNNHLEGLIMTMKAYDDKWSFVELNREKLVEKVVEKEVISDEATVGIYNFRNGSSFVSAAEEMIEKKLTVNGEYYVAPVYNILIENGARIGINNIGGIDEGMYGLGTPKDLDCFLKLPISKRLFNS